MKRIIGYDENGNPNCACDDGNIYINCGSNCECCDHVDNNRVYTPRSRTVFETLSCPCSFQVIENKFGNLECELDNFGVKTRVTPIKITNHTINGKAPIARDKWDCISDNTCGKGNINWDTLYVVFVEETISDKFITLVNSVRSTSKCHIPKTLLTEYSEEAKDIYVGPEIWDGIDINDPEKTANGLPMFDSIDQARLWDTLKGGKTKIVSKYLNKYVSGYYYPNKNLITSCRVNGDDIISHNAGYGFNYTSHASYGKKCEIIAAGGILKIQIKGDNNPMVDIYVKNSSNRSLLKRKLKNVVINGEYELKIDIPRLPSSKTQEHYNIEIKPSADTSYYYQDELISTGVLKYTVWQFNDVRFSFSTTASTISNTTTTTPTVGSATGSANSYSSKSITHVIQVARASGSDNYYLKSGSFLLDDVVKRSDEIKKNIVDQVDEKELECRREITVSKGTSDLEPGMVFTGKITKTKTVQKSIDLDEHLKEPCDDVEILDILTNKFELENTTELFSGMGVVGVAENGMEFNSILESVDCDTTITLGSHHIIEKDTVLTFTLTSSSSIDSIVDNRLKLVRCIRLPKNTEISFNKTNNPYIKGIISVDKSGGSSIKATATINNFYFGQDNVSYAFDVDTLITNKVPVKDQYIKGAKDEIIDIDYTRSVDISNNITLTNAVTEQPKKGVLVTKGVNPRFVTYVPRTGFIGKDQFRFTLSDGVTTSDEKTIFITIE